MNKALQTFIFTAFIFVFTKTASFAQATGSAAATANIVTPISIAKTLDMNFGNIAVSATAGTVVLAPAGTRTKTGGVTLPATVGTVTAATFTVTGQVSYTYSITLPGSALTLTSGANTITVNTFTSNPSSAGALSASGTQTLSVGATLNINASQPAGTYTTGGTPFSVTVNYN